jgi:hypothetical protein
MTSRLLIFVYHAHGDFPAPVTGDEAMPPYEESLLVGIQDYRSCRWRHPNEAVI